MKIANFVKRGTRQVMKKLLSENLFILDGYHKADANIEETPTPTYTESDFKTICPVASGHLPLRAEWLELYSQKYTEEDIKEQFQALVDEHNKVHNPDGQPHKASDRKRTASAAGLLDRSQETSAEIPEDSSAPKNVSELTAKDGPISMIPVRASSSTSHRQATSGSTAPPTTSCHMDSAWLSSSRSSSSMNMSRQRKRSRVLCASIGT